MQKPIGSMVTNPIAVVEPLELFADAVDAQAERPNVAPISIDALSKGPQEYWVILGGGRSCCRKRRSPFEKR